MILKFRNINSEDFKIGGRNDFEDLKVSRLKYFIGRIYFLNV